jgi:adenosine deaminase
MNVLIATTFLDSPKILEHYYDKGTADLEKLKQLHYTELYAREPYKPDYYLKNERKAFFEDKHSHGDYLTGSLEALADMLYFRGRQLYVHNDRFEEWQQEVILSVSPLLVIAYKIHIASKHDPLLDAVELIRRHLKRTCLPSVYEPHLEDVCRNPKLSECHMHLNGSAEPDIVWQDALQEPVRFYRHLRDSFRNNEVEEQYRQLGRFEPQDLYRLFQIALRLRDCLIGVVDGRHGLVECATRESLMERPLYYASRLHPMRIVEPLVLRNSIQYEALFLLRAFSYLDKAHDARFATRFHYYLLIYSFFQKLLVQQKHQVGFDQFQKITNNELRELTEKHYEARFQQLQGMHGNHLCILEGRFATKESRAKLEQLMISIKKGYESMGTQNFDLKLVPHFIKKRDKRKPDKIVTFRDLELRLENKRHADALLDTLRRGASHAARFAQEHIVGFDAASNELHASPEVFAPVFRKLAFMGYQNFTYHAGEDFVHLLSGIRSVYEAVEFLEMKPGNRIGHATALGIEPSLWVKRIGKSIHIKQNEWLDNLIFTYTICSKDAGLSYICRKLEQPILRYFSDVYETSEYLPIQILIQAWLIRKYDPFIALNWREPGVFDGFARQERERFQKADKKARDLYRQYHSNRIIQAGNKLILIASDELIAPAELRLIQCRMIEFLCNKGIAIEMLPSSNVRISHYKNYEEHHMARWFGITKPVDSRPMIVLGSDDTGIFMTNLRNEFAHIHRVVDLKSGKETANKVIADLVNNSKVYSFNSSRRSGVSA